MAEASKILDVLIRLRADTDKATKDIQANTRAVKDLTDGAKKGASPVSALFGGLKGLIAQAAGLFGLGAALRFVTTSLREFAEGVT